MPLPYLPDRLLDDVDVVRILRNIACGASPNCPEKQGRTRPLRYQRNDSRIEAQIGNPGQKAQAGLDLSQLEIKKHDRRPKLLDPLQRRLAVHIVDDVEIVWALQQHLQSLAQDAMLADDDDVVHE